MGAGVEGAVIVGGEQVREEREMVTGQAGKDGAQREGDEEPGTLTLVRSEEEEMHRQHQMHLPAPCSLLNGAEPPASLSHFGAGRDC